jgi:hypothetical protein
MYLDRRVTPDKEKHAMQNLAEHRNRYRWQSAPEGEITVAEVYYDLGGGNVWSGKKESRGIWLSIRPTKIEVHDTYRTETYEIFGKKGARIFLFELKRANPKILAAIAAKLDADIPALAAQIMDTGHIDLDALRAKVAA